MAGVHASLRRPLRLLLVSRMHQARRTNGLGGERMDMGLACPACVGMIGKYNPERYATMGE
jgi:hypothetical protein